MKKLTNEQKEQIKKAMGKRLRDFRKGKKLTLAEVAKKSGKSVQSIHRAEKGEVNMSIGFLIPIADGLDIQVKELFDF